MDSFNVPLLAESSSIVGSYATNNNNNQQQQEQQHLQPQHHQQQLLSHHQKDQMLAAGSTPLMPFINYQPLQKDTQHNPNSNPAVDNFAIDGSQLDGGVSLSGLCERIFASPNPQSNSINNNMEAKLTSESSISGPVILESVTMPSFPNSSFSNRNNEHSSSNNNQVAANVENHQLKPLQNGVAATTTATNTANRRTLHSIEDLAASSCVTNKATTNGNNSNINIATQQQHQQLQLQQQQQQQRQETDNLSGSNLSSEDESISEDEFGLEIDDEGGYQETNSSHAQQCGNGATGGGNPATTGGSSTVNGYMLLAPNSGGTSVASAAAHMSGLGRGVGGASGINVAPGGGKDGHNVGTSASSGRDGGEAIAFKHLFEELCPVCGDKVSGYHYGLLTCESCKGFFKRTVQNKKVYTCVAERSCHIDRTQRKRCPYCRFQKCLDVGMKLEAVRADRLRGGRNKFGPMYKRDRARKLQVMRQQQLALHALRSSMVTEMKPTPHLQGYQQAYPNMNIKQEIQIPQISSVTQSPDSSPSPIAIALGQVNVSGGGVIATPMNASNVGGGNNNNGSNNNSNNNNGNSSSGSGAGGDGEGRSNAGVGGGGGAGTGSNNNNGTDGFQRNGNSNNRCHETGPLQNSAASKLCIDSGKHQSSTGDALMEPLRISPMIREFVQSIDDREWQTQLFALLQKQTYNQVEVDLFELMCKVLDQNLFTQVDWARNTVFFKGLKVDDQMKLLQHSWSDILVLDHLHHRLHNSLPDETQLNNGQVFNLMSLGLLGVPQLGDYFNELQNKLQDLKFDMGDYVCMKFLILLNPDVRDIVNKKNVLEGYENVQAALLDYTLTCYPVNDKFRRLLNIIPEIHAMAARGEDHLYSKHCAGSAPTQTLLMEMLHAKRKV